jgi:hypothetical protein
MSVTKQFQADQNTTEAARVKATAIATVRGGPIFLNRVSLRDPSDDREGIGKGVLRWNWHCSLVAVTP